MDTAKLLDNEPVASFWYRLPSGQRIELTPALKTGDLLRFDRMAGRNLLQDLTRLFEARPEGEAETGSSFLIRLVSVALPSCEAAMTFLYCLTRGQLPREVKERSIEDFADGVEPDQLVAAIRGAANALANFFRKADASPGRAPAGKTPEAKTPSPENSAGGPGTTSSASPA